MPLRDSLAGLKVQCWPTTNDSDSQEIAKQTGASKGVGRPSRPEGRYGEPVVTHFAGLWQGISACRTGALSWCLDGLGWSTGVQVAGDHAMTVRLEQWRRRLTTA